MAYLSVIALADGFQHADEPFFFKALALGDVATKTYRIRQFDSTPLLTSSATAIQTYRYQSHLHGWDLHSTGLPQCAVETCLLSFLQEFILDVFEGNQPVPETITIWVKGRHQMTLFGRLVESLPCLGIALLVRDLENISCPPAKQLLQLHDNKATTRDKIQAYLDWMSEQNLE